MRGRRALVVGALAVALTACTSDPPPGSGADSPPSTASTPTFVGDGSAFCDAMLGVGQIGGAEGATPAEVLAENARLVGLLDEAQANTPADAPPDFDELLDDYRAATEAIGEAGGDVDAAFAALQQTSPELVARLGSSTSHADAFAFLVERCGLTAP